MSYQILLSTTGTEDPVAIPEFGARSFAHATTDFDLLTEFSLHEIATSPTLQDKLDNGHITIRDSHSNISDLRNLLSSKHAEVIVDVNGAGDYTSIAAAFADGASSVFVKRGTYIETSDIILPSQGTLVGEGLGQVNVAIQGTAMIKHDASGGAIENAGTISFTNSSTTVTGSGTTFTNVSAGDYLRTGANWYVIDSITNDTSLEITVAYEGPSQSGVAYDIQTMGNSIVVRDMTIFGSTAANHVIRVRAALGVYFRNVRMFNSLVANLCVEDSTGVVLESIIVEDGTGDGVKISNSHVVSITRSAIRSNGANGINMDSNSTLFALDSSSIGLNAVDGVAVNGQDANIAGCSINGNSVDGIKVTTDGAAITNNRMRGNQIGLSLTSAATEATVQGNHIDSNFSDGVHIAGDDNIISENFVRGNGGSGVELTSDANDNIVIGNNCKNNVGTNILDNGTNTVNSSNKT